MISFRYHLVSIIAVFLALCVGIVVGTTLLSGPVTDKLRDDVDSLKSQRADLDDRVKELQGQVDDAGQFAATYGAQLVAGALKGTNVVLLALPGVVGSDEDGIARQIAAAGGKVTGRVGLTTQYVDPRGADNIRSLATGDSRPLGLTYPETDHAEELGAALLAYVLTGRGEPSDLTSVLASFSEFHMLTTDGNDITPSSTVVIVGNGSLAKKSYAGLAEIALVSAFAKKADGADGAVVVAGDRASARGGGVIALVRGSDVRTTSSTVDNADTPAGEVSTVLALAAAGQEHIGHYGTGAGADALFPSPAQ